MKARTKLKTQKSVVKRFKITKSSHKILNKKSGQDHFNARESGKTTRNKRRLVDTNKAYKIVIKRYMQ